MAAPYSILGIHHLELTVGNASQAAYYFTRAWGFSVEGYAGLETGDRESVRYALRQGHIHLVLNSPLRPDSPLARQLIQHGDAVSDIALSTDNAAAAFESAVAAGAEPLSTPHELRDELGTVQVATVRAAGDIRHTLVQRGDYRGRFLPGFFPAPHPLPSVETTGLQQIDHVALSVPTGQLTEQLDWYKRVLALHPLQTTADTTIRTEHSALRSAVLTSDNLLIRLRINEPAQGPRTSQIDEFLTYHNGPGVQHVAFSTRQIVDTVEALRTRGVQFLDVPPGYYGQLANRSSGIRESIASLRQNHILVDRDDDGYQLQLFTRPTQDRPTLFFEVIDRKGARGLGMGNLRALFEAIEREQAERGNL